MASSLVFTCDSCGVQRGHANHWYLLVCERFQVRVLPWSQIENPFAIGAAHVCGRGCLAKMLTRKLDLQERVDSTEIPEPSGGETAPVETAGHT